MHLVFMLEIIYNYCADCEIEEGREPKRIRDARFCSSSVSCVSSMICFVLLTDWAKMWDVT